MISIYKLILSSLVALSIFLPPIQKEEEWTLKKYEAGISVYSRGSEDSKFKELKSVFQIKSSLNGIAALLQDFESYTGWVYRCGECKLIKRISDLESIHYQTVVAPWPVDDRDFIVSVKQIQNPTTKVIVQDGDCLPTLLPEAEGRVRIKLFRARWIITPLKDGWVNLEYYLLVDPGGSVPAWLVNLAAVDGPFETALHMKEWVQKDKYKNAKLSHIEELQRQ